MSAPGANTGAAPAAATGGRGERFLCFDLGSESYAMPLLSVIEVIAPPEITPVPQVPAHFLGIINLRGQVISVIDLRAKLGIRPSQAAETAIIICDTRPNSLGVVVDAINSVLHPDPAALAPRPSLQGARAGDFVSGVFRHEGRLILTIDIAKTLGASDLQQASSAAKPAAK